MAETLLTLWRAFINNEHDPVIADLITANQYRYRPGMECADWSRIQQRGDQRWTEVRQARRAVRKRGVR